MSGSTMPYYRNWLDGNPEMPVPVGFDVEDLYELAWDTSARSGEETFVGALTQFGCCRPPYDDMWLEIDASAGICPAAYLRYRSMPNGWSGDLSSLTGDIMHRVATMITLPTADPSFIPIPVVIPEGGGVSFVEIPVWYPNGGVFGTYFLSVAYDETGRVISASAFACTSRSPTDGTLLREGSDSARVVVMVALFACAVLHCKNVTTRQERLPRQLHRDRARRGLADIVYRTLVVGPSPGQSGGKSAPKPEKTTRLHLCRGHFAEYGPDYGKGKLFGRLEGRYWVPPHVKGSAENGRVEKTYRVEAA